MKKILSVLACILVAVTIYAGTTINFGWNYGTQGQSPWWNTWTTLFQAVDTELFGVKLKTNAWVDVRTLMDGVGGRPAYADWLVNQSGTDVTATIQAAVDSLTSGAISFPPGIYVRQTTEINLSGKSNITIKGEGYSSVILTSTNTRVFSALNCSNIFIKDLRIHGDFDTATAEQTSQGLITTYNTGTNKSSDILIDNVYLDNLAGDAISLGPGSTRITIRNSRMVGGLGFIGLDGIPTNGVTDIIIIGNHVKASLSSPRIGTAGITGSDDLIDIFGNVQNVAIIGNTLDLGGDLTQTTTASHAVLIEGANPSNGVKRNISIVANTMKNFYGNNATYGSNQSAIGLLCVAGAETDMSNIIIDANGFFYCRNGIYSEGVEALLLMSNNTFEACRRGISDHNGKNHIMRGNGFYGCTEFGIYSLGTSYYLMDGNFFLDMITAGSEAIRCSIVLDHRITNSYIQNGVASGYGIRIPRGQRVLMMMNSIRNHPGTAIQIDDNTSNDCMVYYNSYYNNGVNLTDNGTGTHVNDLPH